MSNANMKKDYCTQNDGDCSSCSLVNYGRDCRNYPLTEDKPAAETAGKKAVSGKGTGKAGRVRG